MTSIANKLHLLLWKNLLLRRRHIFLSICEIALPTILFLLIAYARSKINTLGKEYVRYSTYVEPFTSTDFYNNKLPITDCKLLFTPRTDFTMKLMEEVQIKLSVPSSALLSFNTEADLITYYKTFAKNNTVMAIIFKLPQLNNIPKHLNYDIRFHEKSLSWETEQLFNDAFLEYIPGLGSEKYIDKGFIALQMAIDASFIEMTSGTSLPQITMQEFPYPPHLVDFGISNMFNYIIPIATVFSFIILCASVLKRIVEEKHTGIKELMKMMGLESWMHWLGWFIHAMIPSTISVCIIVYLMKAKLWDAPYPPIEYCDGTILFIFLILYCAAGIIFSFAVSTLFSRPTIAMIFGILIWILPYFVFKSIISNCPLMKWNKKMLLALLPNMALEFGFNAISVYEGREIGLAWNNIHKSGAEDADEFTMFNVLMMLIFDAFFYMILTLYIDNVNPGPYGLPQPHWFPLLKLKKWICYFKIKTKVEDDCEPIKIDTSDNIEPARFLKTGIRIKNLKKKFGNKQAVCGLTIDIYEDQITALLGHNGAGKTTTLSILTGMIQATSGEIEVNNEVIRQKSMDTLRSSLGLCPQENLQFKELTVFEQLKFFAMLKGCNSKEAEDQANEMLMKLNLTCKKNALSEALSGGMRRKLSLGIALIGNPKVLILDEPTSGLDPEARREIWDMLLTFRGSRTVIITTHFMEEADVLGDRIAIMNHGRLVCYGTPMFLKKRYGTGYHLNITLNDRLSKSKESRNSLAEIESIRQRIQILESIVQKHIPQAEFTQESINNYTVLLPINMKSDYGALLEELEDRKQELDISSINLKFTTLEEVFLRVEDMEAKNKDIIDCEETKSNSSIQENGDTEAKNKDTLRSDISKKLNTSIKKKEGMYLKYQQMFMLLKKRFLVLKKLKTITTLQVLLPVFLTALSVYFSIQQFDDYTEKESKLPLDLSIYGKSFVFYNKPSTENFTKMAQFYEDVVRFQNGIPIQVPQVSNAIIARGLENIIHYKEHLIVAAEFNDTHNTKLVNAMYSNKALHGAPISLNLLMNAVLKTLAGSDYSISVTNDPLPTFHTTEFLSKLSTIDVAILWMFLCPMGLIFAVSCFLLIPQIENDNNSKHLQMMCGVQSWFYWINFYLFDLLSYLIIIFLSLLSIGACYFLDITSMFTGHGEFAALLAIFLSYGVSGIPYSYLFSYSKSVANAFAAFIISSLFSGVILTVITIILEMSNDEYYERIGMVLRYLLPVLPQFGLVYTCLLFSIKAVSNYNWMTKSVQQKKTECYFDYNPCCDGDDTPQCQHFQSYFSSPDNGFGEQLVIMVASTLLYFLILIVLETNTIKLWRDKALLFFYQKVYPQKYKYSEKQEEPDKESAHIENSNETDEKAVLLVNRLEKVYGGRHRAVKGISFNVNKMDCFGLLGVNGAGKTTTFRMLTGSEPRTNGNAEISSGNTSYNMDDSEYLKCIGYCPQFDAINELLPGQTVLELFAKLRGLTEEECESEVKYWISALGLDEWADQPCGEYSGGNKRKLSMAIALIGNQKVTMLDEPTSGVDPVSKRKLWDILKSIQADENGSSHPVILTSHSMEECEMLCNKLAIMKDGKFYCIGTIPKLKQDFGQGYTVLLKLKPIIPIVIDKDGDQSEQLLKHTQDNEMVQNVMKDFEEQFTDCTLKDKHSGLLHYHINNRDIKWSTLFNKMEKLKSNNSIIEDYHISYTTLEEVFLSIARAKQDKSL